MFWVGKSFFALLLGVWFAIYLIGRLVLVLPL
jgi:hypothetical protein